MLRVLHFFNIKAGTDEERMLHLVNHGLTEITKPYGCIERKTWKLLDAEAQGQPVQAAAYINEALWPSQLAADNFSHAERNDATKQFFKEVYAGVETVQTLRYVDEEG